MQYITGMHALNLRCSLLTCGDWHAPSVNWEKPTYRLTEESVFGEYGIEYKEFPKHEGTHAVANHIRALLDLLEIGNFGLAQGMNKDFICNDDYNEEIFDKVLLMRELPHWDDIDRFTGKEYGSKWLRFRGRGK